MSKTNNLSSQISQGNPETWITAAEASSILHLSLRTVISRASSGKLPARIPNDAPFTCDGMQNYLIHLEALPQKAQLEYLRNHLPPSQSCGLDLTTPRSSNGDVWLYQFLDVARIIQDAANIRNMYQHTGKVVSKLRDLAEIHGISLSTLYRLCRKSSAKELSLLYLDPVYLQPHLPKTMCLWSADFAYALYLDQHQSFSQNSIFRELLKLEGTSCADCPYHFGSQRKDNLPVCQVSTGTMAIPQNRRTVNRLLSHIPPQIICYCREGVQKWRSDYGHFTLREKPLLVNELWQGDHHVFDLFVRVKVTQQKNDRTYEKEIAVRPVLTAWMDTATGCIVGWVISVLPNADTIAEAFCRAVVLSISEEFHGLPKGILVDCGKDYRSALLQNLPEDHSSVSDAPLYLNRRFAGLGLLPALGVQLHSALPYHPQSKSIERLFGTLEREWICKLKGWCHSSPDKRPANFSKYLKTLLDSKELLSLEEFVQIFQSKILPEYHHFRENDDTAEGWSPELSSMSPIERYHVLEKPYLVTPDWQTLSALKMHHASSCRIRHHGIRFQNTWYWGDELRQHIGGTADVFYHAVEKPLVPSSITVAVNGKFVCEAFPAERLPFTEAESVRLQSHLDGQQKHQCEMKQAITRINQSAAGILPPHATAAAMPEKAQLRNHCYAASVNETAPELSEDAATSSDNPKITTAPSAVSQNTSPADFQEMLRFLFGE